MRINIDAMIGVEMERTARNWSNFEDRFVRTDLWGQICEDRFLRTALL